VDCAGCPKVGDAGFMVLRLFPHSYQNSRSVSEKKITNFARSLFCVFVFPSKKNAIPFERASTNFDFRRKISGNELSLLKAGFQLVNVHQHLWDPKRRNAETMNIKKKKNQFFVYLGEILAFVQIQHIKENRLFHSEPRCCCQIVGDVFLGRESEKKKKN
jgi:hypothetical protein